MSVLLYVLGILCAAAGVAAVVYGAPVNEFSFGNTLIIAGTTAAVGGFILIGLGATVGQLKRIAEGLTALMPGRRPLDMFEAPASEPPSGRIPFPARPRSRGNLGEVPAPVSAATPAAPSPAAPVVPMLRNPDFPVEERAEYELMHEPIPLSPQQPQQPNPPPVEPINPPPPPPENEAPPLQESPAPEPDLSLRAPPPAEPHEHMASPFEAVWPPDEPKPTEPVHEVAPEPEPPPESAHEPPPIEEPVAILKSGVVDGMAYTLYVDGSIEAELPTGTLRFASINELRSHLAKNA